MKLDPVYLLAPEPKPPEAPQVSRRALLVAIGGSMAIGAVLGAGAAIAAKSSTLAEPAHDDGPLSPGLAWAIDVQAGPIELLIQNHESFMIVFGEERDARMLPGIERLVQAVIDDDPAVGGSRATLAAFLAGDIKNMEIAAPLRRYLPGLRSIR